MTDVILLEDEEDIRELIKFTLKKHKLNVIDFSHSDEIIAHLKTHKPQVDLFILDWMVPGKISGLDLCTLLKENSHYKETPVIMLTALTEAENIVQALDAGANDYLTKPFDLNVLLARIRVQLRKPQVVSSDILNYRTIQIHNSSCKVFVQNNEILLTLTEFKILHTLMETPGQVFTREALINKIQGEQVHVTGRTIDTHMAGLRKKLGTVAFEYIETIRGVGYRLKDEP
jgi:DNA-binding response OmpR family regulator